MLKIFFYFIKTRKNKIEKVVNRSTNIKMNLIKTYAMVAVVCSHCSGGAVIFPMNNWISPFFFFMPAFVFVSGYFYNENNDDENFFLFEDIS